MCGLTGFLSHRCHHANQSATIISAMTASLKHRGPDDSGTWINQEDGIALGHQRLAILDLSAAGHQPMHSNNERYVIAYNGEIYNFL
jgi:asparagine synthase (glutamine-hydrolysing)